MQISFLKFWLVTLFFLSSVGVAQDVVLPVTDSAWINGNQPTSNRGQDSIVFVHDFGPKYGLFKFDTAAAGGTIVNSAFLRLRLVDARASGTIDVYEIRESWDESTVTWMGQPRTAGVVTSFDITDQDLDTLAGGQDVNIDVDITQTVRDWISGVQVSEGVRLTAIDPVRSMFSATEASVVIDADTMANVATPGVLDLSSLPVIINRPGLYYLDRNWDLGTLVGFEHAIEFQIPAPADGEAIMDLRGFAISVRDDSSLQSLIALNRESIVKIREGSVAVRLVCNTVCFGTAFPALTGSGRVRIDDVTLSGGAAFDGGLIEISNSRVGGPIVSGQLGVKASHVGCSSGDFCLYQTGDTGQGFFMSSERSVISGNRIDCDWPCAGGISVANGTRVESNVIWPGDNPFTAIAVNGGVNVIRNNAVPRIDSFQRAIVVDGTRNIIEGNLMQGPIEFLQDDNTYGDNRAESFILNGTTQTDWGNNRPFN